VSTRNCICMATLLCAALLAAAEATPPCAVITVVAGDQTRIDTPVSAALPAEINAGRELALFEVKDAARTPVAAQVAFGPARELRWILAGTTAAGATRTFELRYGVPAGGDVVRMELNSKTLDVSFKGAPLFSYNHAHVVPPAKVPPVFIRSGYITPMFSPGGKLLTEDFPADHFHHKGIWMPWTDTEFDGHKVDFWNLGDKQGTVQYAGFESLENGPVFGRFRVKQEHVDLTQGNGGKIALNEVWDVCVWAVGGREGGYWLWDLTSTQTCASASPLLLKAYRYGGIGYRGPKEWKDDNYKVLSSEGHTKKDGHTKTSKWCANSGAVDGKWSTVVFMCSPRNERFPEPMRIWDTGGCFFNYCPIQKSPMTLEPGKSYTFSYRIFVHEGEIDAKAAERAWQDFGNPPAVTMALAGAK
jgi:hypothetical protein